ncbi:DUF488 domain-containing protein [Flavobacterium acetivorans]|uniref:DUF488 domain-containing protein n=1 Tax=Flavobacterium acetivorans TaxID=2893883 RepID=UPI001E3ADE65|nr:DUF488 family protein [Flavobacterium sp. F-29]UFH34638.1 DUF488 family protein [Flavobacterium sp. F-29]
MEAINIKRVYDCKKNDGTYRILIDRLWPRGIKKMDLQFDEWNKEIAPSPELRKWFDHKEEHFEEFSKLYIQELNIKKVEVQRLRSIAQKKTLTLLYGAKSPKINHAIVLKNYLLKVK